MSGGVLDAVEWTSAADQATIGAAFRWFGLEPVDSLLASARRDIEAGALDDVDQAEALQQAADRGYHAIVPSDEVLATAFRRRLTDDPDAFAPV